jgi:pilus assembly protein CpaD
MTRRTPLALALPWALATALSLLAACAPVSTYSEAEAPKNLRLDTSTTHADLRFASGTAQLNPADAAQLRRMAVTGAIGPADRVTVAAAGAPALAEQRFGAVAVVLQQYGIVAAPGRLADLPANHAIVEVGRTLVTLPPCPNWSKPSTADFGNTPSSDFGCATETNLGLMVANPSDLASGRPNGAPLGQPAAAAVQRYLTERVQALPSAASANPFSSAASAAPANAPTPGSQ